MSINGRIQRLENKRSDVMPESQLVWTNPDGTLDFGPVQKVALVFNTTYPGRDITVWSWDNPITGERAPDIQAYYELNEAARQNGWRVNWIFSRKNGHIAEAYDLAIAEATM